MRERGLLSLLPTMILLAIGLAACGRSAEFDPGAYPVLLLADGAGEVKARIPLPDFRFVHSYIHSINLSRVDEEFVVERNGGLLLERVRFDQMSSGMPSDEGDGFLIENGRFVVALSRRFRELPIRVSPVAGHGIGTAEGFIAFSDIFNTGDLVLVRVERGRGTKPAGAGRDSLRGAP